MQTRSEILATLSRGELTRALAAHIISDVTDEADVAGADLSECELEDFGEHITEIAVDIEEEILSLIG